MQITNDPSVSWLKHIRWDSKGLVPVIAQEQGSNDVLMFAWMNREAWQSVEPVLKDPQTIYK
jgi:phosphoribosyl-AMP cyclohydrolase